MNYEDQIKKNQLLGMASVLAKHVPAEKMAEMVGEAIFVVVPVVLRFVPEDKHGELLGALWEALAPLAEKFIPEPEVKT
jgi:hypothetical protein